MTNQIQLRNIVSLKIGRHVHIPTISNQENPTIFLQPGCKGEVTGLQYEKITVSFKLAENISLQLDVNLTDIIKYQD